MAVVIPDLNMIFFLSPGTGSTSLSKFFIDELCGEWIIDAVAGKHATPSDVRAHGYDLSSYICVTTTRNPFDFYISQYHKKRTWAGDDPSLVFARTHDFLAFLDRVLPDTPDGLLHPAFLNHADIVLRKEFLREDVRELLNYFRVDLEAELPTENVSDGLVHNSILGTRQQQSGKLK